MDGEDLLEDATSCQFRDDRLPFQEVDIVQYLSLFGTQVLQPIPDDVLTFLRSEKIQLILYILIDVILFAGEATCASSKLCLHWLPQADLICPPEQTLISSRDEESIDLGVFVMPDLDDELWDPEPDVVQQPQECVVISCVWQSHEDITVLCWHCFHP